MKRVYKKTDGIAPELLGEYLNILPITQTFLGNISTAAMVYYIEDDGSIGTANREDVIIKDDKGVYYPTHGISEQEIIENLKDDESETEELNNER